MHPMLNIAIRAARLAGNVISRYADQTETLNITEKNHNDFVSEVDMMAEQEIIKTLKKAYPRHGFLAEESGGSAEQMKSDEYLWIIDPLDGTTNFLHGFPVYSVSIALQYKGKLDQAVIYDPTRDELFTASRGMGAHLNNRRMRVSKCKALSGALLGTGFPFRHPQYLDTYLAMFKELLPQSAGIRRAGSAAIDLAWVAAGRLDGFWEMGLSPWDIAAGALILQEAGGIITDFHANADYLGTGNVVAGSPKVHQAIIDKLKPYI